MRYGYLPLILIISLVLFGCSASYKIQTQSLNKLEKEVSGVIVIAERCIEGTTLVSSVLTNIEETLIYNNLEWNIDIVDKFRKEAFFRNNATNWSDNYDIIIILKFDVADFPGKLLVENIYVSVIDSYEYEKVYFKFGLANISSRPYEITLAIFDALEEEGILTDIEMPESTWLDTPDDMHRYVE